MNGRRRRRKKRQPLVEDLSQIIYSSHPQHKQQSEATSSGSDDNFDNEGNSRKNYNSTQGNYIDMNNIDLSQRKTIDDDEIGQGNQNRFRIRQTDTTVTQRTERELLPIGDENQGGDKGVEEEIVTEPYTLSDKEMYILRYGKRDYNEDEDEDVRMETDAFFYDSNNEHNCVVCDISMDSSMEPIDKDLYDRIKEMMISGFRNGRLGDAARACSKYWKENIADPLNASRGQFSSNRGHNNNNRRNRYHIPNIPAIHFEKHYKENHNQILNLGLVNDMKTIRRLTYDLLKYNTYKKSNDGPINTTTGKRETRKHLDMKSVIFACSQLTKLNAMGLRIQKKRPKRRSVTGDMSVDSGDILFDDEHTGGNVSAYLLH